MFPSEENIENPLNEITLTEPDLEALSELLVELLRRELFLENQRLGR